MNSLNELIECAQKLSNNLEIASQNELKFCVDICLVLEKMSWETYRLSNDLKEIKRYV